MSTLTQEDADRDWKEVSEQETILTEIINNFEKLERYGDMPPNSIKTDILRYRAFLQKALDLKAAISKYCEKHNLKQP